MLGEKLKQLREDRDIRQKTVANHINKSVQAYSQYEGGKREPDTQTLIQLADYFNVSIDYLLGRTTSKQPSLPISKKNNLYILNVGDLSNKSISKLNDYIDMLRTIEKK